MERATQEVGAWAVVISDVLALPAALNGIAAMSTAGVRHEIDTALGVLGL